MDESPKNAAQKAQSPWWKRPSPWWCVLLGILPFNAMAGSATIAPQIETYTMLACKVHCPGIYNGNATLVASTEIQSIPLNSQTALDGLAIVAKKCAADPEVQAAVAKLDTVMSISTGILSCLTTAWWGAFSDRHGRLSVIGLYAIGHFLTNLLFILVGLYTEKFPGGYWFLILGALLEGALGGGSGVMAAEYAYLADTTTEDNRSRIFSLNYGLMYTGAAFGPTVGSLISRWTGYTLSVFYLTAFTRLVFAILAWFVVPESLSQRQMQEVRAKYSLEVSRLRGSELPFGLVSLSRKAIRFLSPLSIFIPTTKGGEQYSAKRPNRDWNLTLIALCYFCAVSTWGISSYKLQYAASAFGWTFETVGYWLSLVAMARAIFLTAILPIMINLFKPRPGLKVPSTQLSEEEPLLLDVAQVPSSPVTNTTEPSYPSFDLNIARCSLLVDTVTDGCMGSFRTALEFTVSSVFGSAGIGFVPAIRAVALVLYTRAGGTESGRLFGALSLLQALCSYILGPSIYGFVYMTTVAWFPRMIFFVSLLMNLVSLLCLGMVSLPKTVLSNSEGRTADTEA
ncbi:hypothetical protein AMATHDRAFT_142025 [Amanita thiersii Skay4041]|uniref:Major facilitator superfamily (MFS) profile domain-containing protein n=1 Tax=Amanita thiersii Skay4041 TaxID=703135 RepID=A0A2A9NVL6_9AGAR|nr:hypothetical protein AMATHDRAFT_142025 [Amanita thiersii Skay4041]